VTSSPHRVVVSGASGYLGAHLARHFARQGWSVLAAGRDPGADVRFDLADPAAAAAVRIQGGAGEFVHAAAANEIDCRDHPYDAVRTNVAGARAALEVARANGIPTFVYLSTFHVFGNPRGTIDEATVPEPANDYGLTHLQAELYVEMYSRTHGLRGTVVRPSNVFGVPVDIDAFRRWTLVPFAFCRDAVERRRITLHSGGGQLRNFVSAADVSRAVEAVAREENPPPLLHLAGPTTISVRELAELVQRIARQELDVEVALAAPGPPEASPPLDFRSRHGERYRATDRIESYVSEMLRELAARGATPRSAPRAPGRAE
jgi:UDP-glucose 4-epimerase